MYISADSVFDLVFLPGEDKWLGHGVKRRAGGAGAGAAEGVRSVAFGEALEVLKFQVNVL